MISTGNFSESHKAISSLVFPKMSDTTIIRMVFLYWLAFMEACHYLWLFALTGDDLSHS
jgi:hypothetical protein